ncbi:MAG: metallophosphoesterase [Tissierellia bacterium]|nr:metallophosphoesterase [Tissierellia bacterium]
MKIAVISDTHGVYTRVIRYLNESTDIDYLIHLGDHADDADYIMALTNIDGFAVLGNNDYSSEGIVPEERIIEIEGKRILAVHGHRQAVGFGLSWIKDLAEERDVDIVLFGHTHQYLDEIFEGIRFINPGSASLPRGEDNRKCMIVMTIDDDVDIERIFL